MRWFRRKPHPLDAHIRHERAVSRWFEAWYFPVWTPERIAQAVVAWYLILWGPLKWAKDIGWLMPIHPPPFDCLISLGINPFLC